MDYEFEPAAYVGTVGRRAGEMGARLTYRMKLRLIREMPLNHYGYELSEPWTPQSPNGRSKFNARDQKAIKSPKVQVMLKHWLDKRNRKWNIIFIDSPQPFEDARRYMQEHDIPTADHITFVKDKTTGDVFTPWMILHVIGHALTLDHNELFNGIGSQLASLVGTTFEEELELPEYWNKLWPLMPFKSAHNNKVQDAGEIVHELIAFHIKNGYIRFNSNEPKAIRIAATIARMIDNALDKHVGGFLVDDAP